jgi:hypothetical protein
MEAAGQTSPCQLGSEVFVGRFRSKMGAYQVCLLLGVAAKSPSPRLSARSLPWCLSP